MGFFDSLKGFGRALGGLAETTIQTFGPSFAQAGAQLLFNKAFPGQSSGGGGFQTGPGGFADPRQFRIPPTFAPAALPPNVQLPRQVFGDQLRLPGRGPLGGAGNQFFGGFNMPGFPGDRSSGRVTQAGFDIPGLDLQLDIPGFDLRNPFVAQGAGGNTCAPMFVPTRNTIRPASLVMVPNPMTGAPTFFKHAGRPLLFAGDLRAAKQVDKLARRARRSRPRR